MIVVTDLDLKRPRIRRTRRIAKLKKPRREELFLLEMDSARRHRHRSLSQQRVKHRFGRKTSGKSRPVIEAPLEKTNMRDGAGASAQRVSRDVAQRHRLVVEIENDLHDANLKFL